MNDMLSLFLNGLLQSVLFVAVVLLIAQFVTRRVTVQHGVLLSGLAGTDRAPAINHRLQRPRLRYCLAALAR